MTNDNEYTSPLDDPLADPFALDAMPPEPLSFRDWVTIANSLEILRQATKIPEFPDNLIPPGFNDTYRRVKVCMAQAGKENPMELLEVLSESLQREMKGKGQ